jgi:hypothetical protein
MAGLVAHPPGCVKCRVLGLMLTLIRQHREIRRLPPLMQVYAYAAGMATTVVKESQLIDAARGLTKDGHRVRHSRRSPPAGATGTPAGGPPRSG